MDSIRRSAINSNVSISDSSIEQSTNQDTSKPNGLIDAPDQIEKAQTFVPDWSSANQHDPGVTTLELQSFLAEPLLHRADKISQRFPDISTAAMKIAKPFYNNVLKSMDLSDASNDGKLLHDELDKVNEQSTYAVLGNMNNADIEALCFLVLMQAAKSAQEDLKAIMAEVKDINKQKAGWRENANSTNTEGLSNPDETPTDSAPGRFLSAASDALSVYEAKLSSNDGDDDP